MFSIILIVLLVFIMAWPWKRNTEYSPLLPPPLANARSSIQSAALSTLQTTGFSKDLESRLKLDLILHTLGKELSTSRWLQTSIPLCWEPTTVDYSREKTWVIDAVKNSWEEHSPLEFIGWGTCTDKQEGVHIKIADAPPESKALGRNLNRVNDGVILNFEMKEIQIPCGTDRQQCIRTVAVHEFGHVIGLVHEMYNGKVPDTCTQSQGPDGDHSLTPHDEESVMNYCNPLYGNLGKLSKGDILSVKKMYAFETIVGTPPEQ